MTLIDARTPEEFAFAHIDGFRNIPVDELRDRLEEIPEGKRVYVLCESGVRSYIACRILTGHGYDAYNFAGGFRLYDTVVNERCLLETAEACGRNWRI